jgi:predicted anti-sigma-YlaC factor YlaD
MRELRHIVRLLNLPCEGIAALVSQSLDGDLPRAERLVVRLHVLYCAACRRYRRQVLFLRMVFTRFVQGIECEDCHMPPGPNLPMEAREKMRELLRQRKGE